MKSILVLAFVLLTGHLFAQMPSPFERIAKPTPATVKFLKAVGDSTSSPLVVNAVRFAITPVSYSYPGNHVQVGAGIVYEHMRYNSSTVAYDVAWGIGAFAWYNTPITTGNAGTTPPVSYGPAVLFPWTNGLVLAGGSFDGHTFGGVVGLNIKLN